MKSCFHHTDLLSSTPEKAGPGEDRSEARGTAAAVWRQTAGGQDDTGWLQHPECSHTAPGDPTEGRAGQPPDAVRSCPVPICHLYTLYGTAGKQPDHHPLLCLSVWMVLEGPTEVFRAVVNTAKLHWGTAHPKLLSSGKCFQVRHLSHKEISFWGAASSHSSGHI